MFTSMTRNLGKSRLLKFFIFFHERCCKLFPCGVSLFPYSPSNAPLYSQNASDNLRIAAILTSANASSLICNKGNGLYCANLANVLRGALNCYRCTPTCRVMGING